MSAFPGAHWYSLSPERDANAVSCDEQGVFIGSVPPLERRCNSTGAETWAVRPARDLDAELSARFGVPIDTATKRDGLAAIARALGRGDLALAKIAAVQLRLPDLPQLEKGETGAAHLAETIGRLLHSGMLKTNWDENRHPRWPAGTSDSRGGEFRPADAAESQTLSSPEHPSFSVTQAIPLPGAIPFPFELPFPTEIMPFGPIIVPDGMERDGIPTNPYPDNPECEE